MRRREFSQQVKEVGSSGESCHVCVALFTHKIEHGFACSAEGSAVAKLALETMVHIHAPLALLALLHICSSTGNGTQIFAARAASQAAGTAIASEVHKSTAKSSAAHMSAVNTSRHS